MGWLFFIVILVIICFLVHQLQEQVNLASLNYGPRQHLSRGTPGRAEGYLTWKSGLSQAYTFSFLADRVALTGQYESELGIGQLRTKGEIFLYYRAGQVEGRYSNGTATSVVSGRLEPNRADLKTGFSYSGRIRMSQPLKFSSRENMITIVHRL